MLKRFLIVFCLITMPVFRCIAAKYQVAVCAMFQDEAPYFKEWLEFHMLIGVEHFYLYNNLSTDDFMTVLEPYIANNQVTLIDWPYRAQGNWDSIQRNAYDHALSFAKEQTQWLGFIDLDEYIMPQEHGNLLDVLQEYVEFGGLCIHWQLFGTSHVRRIGKNTLTLEALLWRAPTIYDAHYRVKSIVQPKRVIRCKNQHVFEYEPPYFHVLPNKHTFTGSVPKEICCDHVQINHYWTRDTWYFMLYKLPRRTRYNNGLDIKKRALQLNHTKDTSALRFVSTLRTIVFKQ